MVLGSWWVNVWTLMVRRDPLLVTIVASAGESAVCGFVRWWWLLLSWRTDRQSVLVSRGVSVRTSMVRRDPLLATIVASAGVSAVCGLSGGECCLSGCQSVLVSWWVSERVMRTGRRHSFPVRRRSAISFKGLKVRVRIHTEFLLSYLLKEQFNFRRRSLYCGTYDILRGTLIRVRIGSSIKFTI